MNDIGINLSFCHFRASSVTANLKLNEVFCSGVQETEQEWKNVDCQHA